MRGHPGISRIRSLGDVSANTNIIEHGGYLIVSSRKSFDHLHYPGQLLVFKLRIHRDRKNRVSQPFGDGKITFVIPQRPESWLEMERNRVVYSRTDSLFSQVLFQIFASIGLDDVEMVYMPSTRYFGW